MVMIRPQGPEHSAVPVRDTRNEVPRRSLWRRQVAMTTGYAHFLYASSLAEFGQPRFLPHCEGWILERDIPGSTDRDGMGCYPLFACRNWSGREADLAELENKLVSVVMVTDPFGAYEPGKLSVWFNHGAVPFKEHYVDDLSQPIEQSVSRHHRRNARKA